MFNGCSSCQLSQGDFDHWPHVYDLDQHLEGGAAAVTEYGYDVQDHLTSVTDAEGNVTTYTYGDRDLMTQEVSPVSGTTSHQYNEHGELTTTIDARGVVVTRQVDPLDRATLVDYSDNSLDTTLVFDDPSVSFSKGRLTEIARDGASVDYAYDRFGRTTQDGALGYEYDANGNRTLITYPGGVTAAYTHDFADREATLEFDDGVNPPQMLATGATYKPFGPLASLTLGNGLVETRTFDTRYFPARIQAGSLLDWIYTEDEVGNPTEVAGTIVGQPYTETFGYQDPQYFLTQGDGPWGGRSWSYDRIGNRLTSQESGEPLQSYAYAAPGHNPKLTQVMPAPGQNGGSWQIGYDAAGNLTTILESDAEEPLGTNFFEYSQESKLSALRTSAGPSRSDLLYDGRGFLLEAHLTVADSPEMVRSVPVYSSEGMLLSRAEDRIFVGSATGLDGEDLFVQTVSADTTHLFYFGGRPVAQLTTGPELIYLTTDHLGTPVLGTDPSGAAVWAGGLEPFGRVWTAAGGTPDLENSLFSLHEEALSGLPADKVFLRYPGQWVSDAFRVGGARGELYYNVHRWYQQATGAYTQPDPLDRASTAYLYSFARPTRFTDPLGLFSISPNCNTQCGPFNMDRELRAGLPGFGDTLNWPPCRKLLERQRGFQGQSLLTLMRRCDGEGSINCDCSDTSNYGRHPLVSIFGPAITICGGNFTGIGAPYSPFQRGYGLAETVFHECLHWARFGGVEPDHEGPEAALFREIERTCFDWPPR